MSTIDELRVYNDKTIMLVKGDITLPAPPIFNRLRTLIISGTNPNIAAIGSPDVDNILLNLVFPTR
jgi:hypothetical protein